ncbi:MAG TPA: chromosome segregation protein SMC [Sedimenticola thiotaurini]|uniref:Chromosome partition protein Smc n=1 Tax=Sedimenticola thiotaurini TaxID=1543721 RepID=A0A831W6A1_9GAMM|nr:chromosome segregation protein SMC [Sedimenticola thiotaurini]
MRLEKIKLAGFKSFVDPTTVRLPSNLVGIVGPNGCGKSNVIDAVRWVMGESSAKMLRGESMADVIFNGSASRKPVGTASIELVFDNSDGSAGGEFAQYAEISVRRQVSRDGQSVYYLNGVRCRRRDITDLFLGTGLGPRSYSIIEQGTISRLIEARPEELRAFLEEAAGISKYKERRRETQNRINRTRENLDRLNDLREEISKQLQHLQRQAATAERYKEYKEKERRLQAELLVLRWRALHDELERRDRELAEQEKALEAAIADQRRLEAEIEAERERHAEANDRFNEIQGSYYAVGSDIARLEQAIQFARENRSRLERDLEQTERSLREASEHRRQDEARLQELTTLLGEEEPRLERIQAVEEAAAERLAAAEQAMNEWQLEWERFNREAAVPGQTAQVERTSINHHEQQEQSLRQRLARYDDELQRLEDPRLAGEIAGLVQREADAAARAAAIQEELEQASERIRQQREQNRSLGQDLNETRAALQQARGRQASLEALQEAALGGEEEAVAGWLEQEGLAQAARLAQRIRVADGWEQAVEMVLGHQLQAVCVERLEPLARELERLEQGSLGLLEQRPATGSGGDGGRLLDKVESPVSLDHLLHGVRLADDLEQALAFRFELAPGESLVTRDGIWVGANWIRLGRDSGAQGGVLQREQELRQLAGQVERLTERSDELELALESGRQRLQQAEQRRDELQRQLDGVNRELAEIRTSLGSKRTREEHLRNRREHVRREQADLQRQLEQGRTELEAARARLHAALAEMEGLAQRREALIRRRDELREQLAAIREESGRQRHQLHEMALRVESMRSSRDSLAASLERAQGQLSQLQQRRDELVASLEQRQAPLQEQNAELERLLERRVTVEAELADARRLLEQTDARLRELEQRRASAEQAVQKRRSTLDQSRMQRQEVLVRARTLEEQLGETGFQRDELLRELPGDAGVDQWQQEVERMDLRIRRLGPINLAAIDEFQEQSERMHYLDAQHADITESLETLENAIRKIDRETRTRFKETYDKVNTGLQEKFPRLFGGGHAYLQLTGEDLLDTGVTVMARPPGKRNTSIHLLSGGEKALTAVALVFSIFELNPAPFCMLDEVDAPLDDANVGRFCDMVKAMSDRVQFIFITHNKITMEIANQLSGVTMHEPGVSRLVSVDVDEAARIAAM